MGCAYSWSGLSLSAVLLPAALGVWESARELMSAVALSFLVSLRLQNAATRFINDQQQRCATSTRRRATVV